MDLLFFLHFRFLGISPAAEFPLLIESFYFSVTGITVTDVGSNSGVLGRSGSGGLGGAAAGLGSSFFFGAIVDGSQETKGGAAGEGDQANRQRSVGLFIHRPQVSPPRWPWPTRWPTIGRRL